VKSENAIGAQLARRGEAVDHPLRRQMGRHGGEHLATHALDITGAKMVSEQAGDIDPPDGRRPPQTQLE
jgi:hypothetical protein